MTPSTRTARPPRVPTYAWSWLQRSRPVLAAVAERLTGGPPTATFVEEIRATFAKDRFTRDVVIATVAEVAFSGRIPKRRPPGAAWDRGLVWWAATIAGVTPAEFDARSRVPTGHQPRLFDAS